MLVCESHRFVFVHVHRTGGTSITELCTRLPIEVRGLFWQHTHLGSERARDFPFERYRVLGFVRNPLDRLHSWYQLFQTYNPRRDQEQISFAEFLHDYERIAAAYGLDEEFHFNQVDYFTDREGQRVPCSIGRFESFESDARRLFDELGLDLPPVRRLNTTRSDREADPYTPELRRIVADRCARDIEVFGFDACARHQVMEPREKEPLLRL